VDTATDSAQPTRQAVNHATPATTRLATTAEDAATPREHSARPELTSVRERREASTDRGTAPHSADERLGSSLLNAFDRARPDQFTGVARTEGLDKAAGMSTSDRVAHLLDLRDTAAERPLSSVLLRLDSPDGGEDRIRIDLRGNTIGAALDMTDRGMAEDIGRHMGDLARAMERQGLDPESLSVRTLGVRDAATGFSQAVAGERDAIRTASAGNAGTGTSSRDSRGTRQDTPQEESPRQRSRRDPKGER
jgi:hypothetical protein